MFVQVCLIVGALAAGEFTLPNGIRVVELPPQTQSFELQAGYEAPNGALTSAISTFLFASAPARRMAVIAYGAGGRVETLTEPNRAGIRVTGPSWAKSLIEAELGQFFLETPESSPQLVAHAAALAANADPPDFRAGVEDDIRAALLGFRMHPDVISPADVEQFFRENFGTDRAFVVTSGPLDAALEQVAARPSVRTPRPAPQVSPATRSMQYTPDLPDGAVILAAPAPSVYYERWYATLLLDHLIRRTLPRVESSGLSPSTETSYIRLEVKFPEGEFDDTVAAALVADLEALHRFQLNPESLEAARGAAVAYLESESVQRWFQSLGIESRRLEGIELVRSLSPDQVRAAARDLLAERVVAGWSPRPRRISVEVEDLNAAPAAAAANEPVPLPDLAPIVVPDFPPHAHAVLNYSAPRRLASNVSLVESSRHAIFVAPSELRYFDREPAADEAAGYAAYRPQRLLVMAPPEALGRAEERWAGFSGNTADSEAIASMGAVANVDLPALLILKMIIDRRLMEAGLWNAATLDIQAASGSMMVIRANDEIRRRLLGWIEELAMVGPSDEVLSWAREAAFHHLDDMLPELQSLIWQRDRLGAFGDVQSVTAGHVQDVARIYFQ